MADIDAIEYSKYKGAFHKKSYVQQYHVHRAF